ncbi:hypothetical protein N9L76_03740 [bacterium]|nr:hypothetical protein [bacterium]
MTSSAPNSGAAVRKPTLRRALGEVGDARATLEIAILAINSKESPKDGDWSGIDDL